MSNQTRTSANTLFKAPAHAPEVPGMGEEVSGLNDTDKLAELFSAMSEGKAVNPFAQALASNNKQEAGILNGEDYIEGVTEEPADPQELTDLRQMFDEETPTQQTQERDPLADAVAEDERQHPINAVELHNARAEQDAQQTAAQIEYYRQQLAQQIASLGPEANSLENQAVLTNVVDQQTGVGAINYFDRAIQGARRRIQLTVWVITSDKHSGGTWSETKRQHNMWDNPDGGAHDNSGA